MRILIVEDDPLLGDGVVSSLRSLGFVVDWFRSGDEAERALGTVANLDDAEAIDRTTRMAFDRMFDRPLEIALEVERLGGAAIARGGDQAALEGGTDQRGCPMLYAAP